MGGVGRNLMFSVPTAVHLEFTHEVGPREPEVTGGGDEVLQRLLALQPQHQVTVLGSDRGPVVGLDPQGRFTGGEGADDLADRHLPRGTSGPRTRRGHRAPTALS